MVNRKIIVFVFFVLLVAIVKSQPIDFYPFYGYDQTLNPAYSGKHSNEWNIYNKYTNRQVLANNSFSTLYVGGDYNFHLFPNVLSVGGFVNFDQVINAPVNITKVYASVAFHKRVGGHLLHIGLQPGLVNYGKASSTILFPDQYDRNAGGFNAEVPTFETAFFEPIVYFDANIGASFLYNLGKWKPELGITVFNILKPEISGLSDFGKRNIGIDLTANYRYTQRVELSPVLYVLSTQKFAQAMVGTKGSYWLPENPIGAKNVFAGVMLDYRTSDYPGAFVCHAGLISLKVDYSYWSILMIFAILASNIIPGYMLKAKYNKTELNN
jgi:hypothetical protein